MGSHCVATVSPPFATLNLAGELDIASAADVRRELAGALAQGGRTVVLQLAEVTFLDCAGVDALLWCHRRVLEAGGELTIQEASPQALRLLQLTGTARRLGAA